MSSPPGKVSASMRISELARKAGVSVATVKFYLREGLLLPGTPTSARSATYDERHLERLRLLRVLREVGDVPIARLRDVVNALDADELPPLAVMASAVDALSAAAGVTPGPGAGERPARATAEAIVARAGWTAVRPDAPEIERLAELLEVVMSFGTHEAREDILDEYVGAADRIGRADIANLDATQSFPALLSEIVVGQVVFGEMLLSLRRLAEEHYANERFASGEPGPPAGS